MKELNVNFELIEKVELEDTRNMTEDQVKELFFNLFGIDEEGLENLIEAAGRGPVRIIFQVDGTKDEEAEALKIFVDIPEENVE